MRKQITLIMLNIQSSKLIVLYNAWALSFTEEVESLFDFVDGGTLVDANITDSTQQGKVDDAILIFLIMAHQFYQFVVVIAGDRKRAIVLLDEVHRLSHLLRWESRLHHTQIEFRNQTERHSIAVQNRLAFQCPAFKGMTESMSQVERLADAVLMRILLYDALLYRHAIAHHALQLLQVGMSQVEANQLRPHLSSEIKPCFSISA